MRRELRKRTHHVNACALRDECSRYELDDAFVVFEKKHAKAVGEPNGLVKPVALERRERPRNAEVCATFAGNEHEIAARFTCERARVTKTVT